MPEKRPAPPPTVKVEEAVGPGPPSVFYPDLMPGRPPPSAMLSPEPATQWLFADFDEMFAPFVEWNARINGQFR